MANRKKGARTRRSSVYRWIPLLLITCFALVLLYLYGQVEIGLNIRTNGELTTENTALQQELDRLTADVNRLKSYPRIAKIVESVNLGPVSADRQGNLEVDLNGAYELRWTGEPLHYASIAPFYTKVDIKAAGGK